ncbi:hypothetical protein CC2G_014302 [Coprinopsis cinerea AmutBmut pab1-1]|nr:hypothetical protein CC2G_014302 [Coprinopsis cinerea AmutBmut pab1-1]
MWGGLELSVSHRPSTPPSIHHPVSIRPPQLHPRYKAVYNVQPSTLSTALDASCPPALWKPTSPASSDLNAIPEQKFETSLCPHLPTDVSAA